MNNIKNNIKIISIIIGTLIGAGFASGKEIYLFFSQYGNYGILGLLFSNIFIGYIIYKTFLLISKYNINTYSKLLDILLGKNTFKKIFIFFINLFLLFSFYIMISGFNSFFYQEFNISKIIICFFISLICYIIFTKNISNILNINFILIPILIFFIFLFGFLDFSKINILNYYMVLQNNNCFKCIIKSFLYTNYNIIILIPILISLKKYLINKKQFICISIFSTIFLFTLSFIIFTFIILIDDAHILEIPIISSIKKFSILQKDIYSIVIAIAIFTSALSSGFAFINNLNIKNKYYIFLICFFPLLLIKISFSTLMNIVFNFFGLIGVFQIIFILLKN